jgi:hypothetical protein
MAVGTRTSEWALLLTTTATNTTKVLRQFISLLAEDNDDDI